MIGVIIAANERDRKMWGTLPDILRRNFPTRVGINGGDTSLNGEARFVVCPARECASLQADSAVVIYKDVDCAPATLPAVRTVAVVDSGNPALLETVSATKLPAITCGLSPRDTITLTSFSDDSAVLGLQRSVHCFDGTVAEPQEIPLKLGGPMDSYTLMAACSAFILSGNIGRLKYADFQSNTPQ